MSDEEQRRFLKQDFIVEEKLDGANIGISLDPSGKLQVQNRGSYLIEPYSGQFSRLPSWLAINAESLDKALKQQVILFGEWCAAKHSIEYSSLPDLFLLFDVYDLIEKRFWSAFRRDALATSVGLKTVPKVEVEGGNPRLLIKQLNQKKSKFSNEHLEGFIFRVDCDCWNIERAKLVRQEFTQTIEEHWAKKRLTWNRLAAP
ncbi:MAG: RNA ligase family protein [Shimia thalassica]